MSRKPAKITKFQSESELFDGFAKLIHSHNPEIIVGWEIQKQSLGHILERDAILGRGNFSTLIGKTPKLSNERIFSSGGGGNFREMERKWI